MEALRPEPLTLDDVNLRPVFSAILRRAVKDAQGHCSWVYPRRARKVQLDAYGWLMSPDALVYAELAGVPVAQFKRLRATVPDPRLKEVAA